MHAYDVLGYTYDCDTHCPDCARERFGSDDRGYVPDTATDSEGNFVGAIFDDTEWYDYYATEAQSLYCGTCSELIDEYTSPFVHDEEDEQPSCIDCTLSWANLCPRDRAGLDRNSAECDSFTDVPITNQLTLEVDADEAR